MTTTPDPNPGRTTDASAAALHIRRLLHAGWTTTAIADHAGCARNTITTITDHNTDPRYRHARNGRRINTRIHNAILSIPITTRHQHHRLGVAHTADIINPELIPYRWTDHAACRGSNPDTWYPHGNRETDIAAAKQTCHSCPVRRACLEAGLGEPFGIWGGLTERERRRERRRRRQEHTT